MGEGPGRVQGSARAEESASERRVVYQLTAAGVSALALICAELTRETRRFQSSSAPRVLLSPQGWQRELEQWRMVVRNYAERLRAGSSPAPVSGSSARKGVGVRVPASAPTLHRLLHENRVNERDAPIWRPPAFVILLALAGLTACGPFPKGEYWQGSFLHSFPPQYSRSRFPRAGVK